MADTSTAGGIAASIPSIINSSWGFLSVLVCVIGLVTCIWMLTKKSWKFKFGPVEANDQEPSTKKQDENVHEDETAQHLEDPVSPHFNCPHAHDISEVARRTAALGQEKAALKLSTFNMQIKFYDEQTEKIMEMLRHSMIKLITTKTDKSIPFIDHPDYKRCENIIHRIEAELRVYFVARFTENHYATYDIDGQLRYVEDKVNIVLTKLTSKLNMYWCCQVVTREDIYESNKAKLAEYTQLIEAIFTEAFSLARECAEQEKAMDAAYTEFLEGTVGGNV